MGRSQVFKQQAAAGFQSGHDETDQESRPTDHAVVTNQTMDVGRLLEWQRENAGTVEQPGSGFRQ